MESELHRVWSVLMHHTSARYAIARTPRMRTYSDCQIGEEGVVLVHKTDASRSEGSCQLLGCAHDNNRDSRLSGCNQHGRGAKGAKTWKAYRAVSNIDHVCRVGELHDALEVIGLNLAREQTE